MITNAFAADDNNSSAHGSSGKALHPEFPTEKPAKNELVKWLDTWKDELNTSGYAARSRRAPACAASPSCTRLMHVAQAEGALAGHRFGAPQQSSTRLMAMALPSLRSMCMHMPAPSRGGCYEYFRPGMVAVARWYRDRYAPGTS